MISDHVSADAGSAPSCTSVAWPAKETASPTRQVKLDAGESITPVGAVLPAGTGTDGVGLRPGRALCGRVDHDGWRGVAGRDRDRCGVARALVVGDSQARVIDPCDGVDVRGCRPGRIAERAVAVEIPGV